MKIGIAKAFASKNYYGGISVQGRMWYEGLQRLGDEVYLLDNWSNYDWDSFDWIIILGTGNLYREYIQLFSNIANIKIASAPIIDYTGSVNTYRLRGKYQGLERIHWHSPIYDEYHLHNKVSLYLVRSQHEKRFLTDGLKFSEDNIRIVPLNCRISSYDDNGIIEKKENFVFHVSRLLSKEKNVKRLIEAAKKYEFELLLAGTVNGPNEMRELDNMINGCSNIQYVGRLSDKDLISYYRRAKVFALPSIIEGVGMVALEAASYGCNIVLTNLGAPKEYFDGKAFLVDPYDVDDIGKKIQTALADNNVQPSLKEYIKRTFSEKVCIKQLHDCLTEFNT